MSVAGVVQFENDHITLQQVTSFADDTLRIVNVLLFAQPLYATFVASVEPIKASSSQTAKRSD